MMRDMVNLKNFREIPSYMNKLVSFNCFVEGKSENGCIEREESHHTESINEGEIEYIDFQKVQVVEKRFSDGAFISPPMEIILTGDMVNSVIIGDHINVMGIPRFTDNNSFPSMDVQSIHKIPYLDISLEEINLIKEMGKDPDIIKKLIVSFAPFVVCSDNLKLVLILQQFCRSNHISREVRKNIHILILGKKIEYTNKLLNFASLISPNGLYINSRNPRLKIEGKLEASNFDMKRGGPLVLANSGVLALDEIQKLSKEQLHFVERSMHVNLVEFHEGLLSAKFITNTSILASFTKKVYSDHILSIDLNNEILAYFDFICPLDDDIGSPIGDYDRISPDLFRKYIYYATTEIQPKFSCEVRDYFFEFSKEIKVNPHTNNVLGLLLMAVARMQLKEEVTIDDVKLIADIISFYSSK